MEFEKLTKLNKIINNPIIYKNKKNIVNETPHKKIEIMNKIYKNNFNLIFKFNKIWNSNNKSNQNILENKDKIVNNDIKKFIKINDILKTLKLEKLNKNILSYEIKEEKTKNLLKIELQKFENYFNSIFNYYNRIFNYTLETSYKDKYNIEKQTIQLNYYKKQFKNLKIENENLLAVKIKNNKSINDLIANLKFNNNELNKKNLNLSNELLIYKKENENLKIRILKLTKEIKILKEFNKNNSNIDNSLKNKTCKENIEIKNNLTHKNYISFKDNINYNNINYKNNLTNQDNITNNNITINDITYKDSKNNLNFNKEEINSQIINNKYNITKQTYNYKILDEQLISNNILKSINRVNSLIKTKYSPVSKINQNFKYSNVMINNYKNSFKANEANISDIYSCKGGNNDKSVKYIQNKDYIKKYVNKSLDKSFKSSFLKFENGKIMSNYKVN